MGKPLSTARLKETVLENDLDSKGRIKEIKLGFSAQQQAEVVVNKSHTALKSCEETDKLTDIQVQASKEAKIEYQRVKKAHEMFETLRDQRVLSSGAAAECSRRTPLCVTVSVAVKLHCVLPPILLSSFSRGEMFVQKKMSI
ncbi:hypothetical protein V8G54_010155 [Vigna mungo]|uniref:NET2A-D/KIP1-like alpha-helical domain-containing protein n=1 Tax=Vigna mungo TaxID=3915 RepID=A0AAQ3NX16_VIGMU